MFEYLIKYAFYFLLSIVLMVVVGPKFYSLGTKSSLKFQNVATINFSNYSGNKAYLIVDVVSEDKNRFSKRYYFADGEYSEIENILFEKKLIPDKNLSKHTPILLTKKELESFSRVKVSGSSNVVESLLINDSYLIGGSGGVLKFLNIFFGITITLLGLFLFILFVFLFVNNLREYWKTGKLPELPNSIDSKIAGWKIILGIKNTNHNHKL